MILKKIFTQNVVTVNSDIKEDKYTKQWFFFGMKIYQDDYDYKNETTNQKTGFK
jgi:hypothetical protein